MQEEGAAGHFNPAGCIKTPQGERCVPPHPSMECPMPLSPIFKERFRYVGNGYFVYVLYKDDYEKVTGDLLPFWHPAVLMNFLIWEDGRCLKKLHKTEEGIS